MNISGWRELRWNEFVCFRADGDCNCMNRQRMNNPNKKYKELKQKQKARISDLMYRETDRFLREKKQPPDNDEVVQIAERVYRRIQGLGFWIPYGEVLNEYQKKCPHILQRLQESGLPQHLLPKTKKEPSADPMSTSKEKQRKTKGHRQKKQKKILLPEQDDTFFFIAGYTSGGAPTWEEMELEPWEEIE